MCLLMKWNYVRKDCIEISIFSQYYHRIPAGGQYPDISDDFVSQLQIPMASVRVAKVMPIDSRGTLVFSRTG